MAEARVSPVVLIWRKFVDERLLEISMLLGDLVCV